MRTCRRHRRREWRPRAARGGCGGSPPLACGAGRPRGIASGGGPLRVARGLRSGCWLGVRGAALLARRGRRGARRAAARGSGRGASGGGGAGGSGQGGGACKPGRRRPVKQGVNGGACSTCKSTRRCGVHHGGCTAAWSQQVRRGRVRHRPQRPPQRPRRRAARPSSPTRPRTRTAMQQEGVVILEAGVVAYTGVFVSETGRRTTREPGGREWGFETGVSASEAGRGVAARTRSAAEGRAAPGEAKALLE